MKLVFDTNVLIAAFATRGHTAEVFEHCLKNHSIHTSTEILQEFEEKMAQKLKFKRKTVEEYLRFLKDNLATSLFVPLPHQVCRDPRDDHVLGLALGSNADAMITGDQDLLVLHKFRGIPILKPAEFWGFEKGLK